MTEGKPKGCRKSPEELRPKGWGPGTDGPVWCADSKRWVFPLNAVGRAAVEGYLAKYNDWPLAPLKARDGRLYRKLLAYFGEEEADAMARRQLVRSAAHYHPAAFGCSPAGYTYMVQGLWLHFSRAVQLEERSWDGPREVQPPEADGEEFGLAEVRSREPTAEEAFEAGERVGAINAALRALDRRSRRVVVAYYQAGMTADEIGRREGVGRQRVLQLLWAALDRMRAALTRQNPPDELGPLRSHECPTDAGAASRPSSPGRTPPRPSPPSPRGRAASGRRPRRSGGTT